MHGPVSTRYLPPRRLPRAAMLILASTDERVVHHRKFPGVVRTFHGNRRDESSSPNRPVKRTTVRLAKTNCKQSGSQQFQNFKATRGRMRISQSFAKRNSRSQQFHTQCF